MTLFVVNLSTTSEKGQRIRIGEGFSKGSDFSFDGEFLVEIACFLELINQEDLLTCGVHSMSSEDVQNEIIRVWVLCQLLHDVAEH